MKISVRVEGNFADACKEPIIRSYLGSRLEQLWLTHVTLVGAHRIDFRAPRSYEDPLPGLHPLCAVDTGQIDISCCDSHCLIVCRFSWAKRMLSACLWPTLLLVPLSLITGLIWPLFGWGFLVIVGGGGSLIKSTSWLRREMSSAAEKALHSGACVSS
jgi:hypothetical protein